MANTPQDEAETLRGMVDQGGGTTGPDDDPQEQVNENPDGSATVTRRMSEAVEEKDFYRNIAENLDPTERDEISTSLLDLIDKDKKAREKRDAQYEEGVKRMGLDKETIGGANFSGASNVTHPMYTKACIDFEARAIKELFPPGGPVREYIPGTITPERADRARRKARWLNFQLTQLMPNFRAELEQVLINLPMGGNQYQKLIPPAIKMMVGHEWIPIDKMLLPFAATNFYTAERRTHIQEVTAQEFTRRIRTKMYRDVELSAPAIPEETKTQQTVARIEGKESDSMNADGLRTIFECDCLFEIRDPDIPKTHTEALQDDADGDDLGEDGKDDEATEIGPLPYLISIDVTTKEILSIYRNWAPEDEDHERLEWTVEWVFIPFRGAYALGLPHIIGGLSIAATGALRALLDSAHINNMAGLLRLKGAVGTGQNIQVRPTEVTEIENSGEIDDIRKIIMAVPFGPPSPVLLTLLGILGDQAEQVIRTTIDEAEAQGDVPVGTTLARIEQGMVAFSAIHGRLHRSMDRLLKILHRINKVWLEDKVVLESIGEQIVTTKDFSTDSDVIPVSDPDIFCEVQRYGQIQTVAQRAVLLPQIYDLRKVEELILKQMKLPNDGQDLLVPKPTPIQMNPVNENVALTLGRPIVAFPQQDHEAHINAHCDFFENPFFSALVSSNPGAITALLQNLKEHIVFWYAMKVHQVGSDAATQSAKALDPKSGPVDIGNLPQDNDKDPEIGQKYDQMLAAVSVRVMQMATQDQTLQRATQAMAKLQGILQKIQPPQVMDPSQASIAIAHMDNQTKQQKIEADQQTAGQKMQQQSASDQQQDQTKKTIAVLQQDGEDKRREQQDLTKLEVTERDNQTALAIAGSKALEGRATQVKNGEAIGKSGNKPST